MLQIFRYFSGAFSAKGDDFAFKKNSSKNVKVNNEREQTPVEAKNIEGKGDALIL